MKIVIIGASFAGVSCALELRRINKEVEITIIDQKNSLGYFSGGLIQTLKGNFSELSKARWMNEDTLREQNIHLYLKERVKEIKSNDQKIATNKRIIPYDKLILASGAKVSPNLQREESQENYFILGQLEEDQQLLKKIELAHVITIIGAGTTGVELADALCHMGKKVCLIEQYAYPLFKYFDGDFLVPFIETLALQPRLETYFNQHALLKRAHRSVEISLGKQNLSSELLVFSGSLIPNHEYLDNTVLLNSDRTIRVNDHLQTSIPTIYAIGNLIQQRFPLTRDWYFMPSRENAERTGRAVARILLGKQSTYEGSLRPMTIQAFSYFLGSVGLLASEAFLYEGEIDIQHEIYTINHETLHIQYVFDKNSNHLLGVQAMTKAGDLSLIIPLFEEAIYQKSSLTKCLSTPFSDEWQKKLRQSFEKKGRDRDET